MASYWYGLNAKELLEKSPLDECKNYYDDKNECIRMGCKYDITQIWNHNKCQRKKTGGKSRGVEKEDESQPLCGPSKLGYVLRGTSSVACGAPVVHWLENCDGGELCESYDVYDPF